MNLEILSGDFTGYYSYNNLNDIDHEMHCSLVFFQDGRIVGHGVDDVDPFHFEGNVDLKDNSVILMKKYPGHQVKYTGTLNKANNCISISGIWSIDGLFSTTGAFTLRKGHSQSSIMADIDLLEQTLRSSLTTIQEREL